MQLKGSNHDAVNRTWTLIGSHKNCSTRSVKNSNIQSPHIYTSTLEEAEATDSNMLILPRSINPVIRTKKAS